MKKETIFDRVYIFLEDRNQKSGSVQPSVISPSGMEHIQNQTAIKDKKLDPELLLLYADKLEIGHFERNVASIAIQMAVDQPK